MKEIFDKLNIKKEEYFMTGSRALDTQDIKYSSEDSDYDYVVLITNRHTVINYFNEQNIQIEPSCYNSGFKVQLGGKVYNIITPIWIEFMAWREALVILRHLIKKDEKYRKALKNKLSRYCLYEQLRGLLKTAIRLGEVENDS
jgi:hypothetical protein